MSEEFDRKSTGKSGSGDGRIPESKARDGKMLTEREPWNGGMVPEREARRKTVCCLGVKVLHALSVCVCVCVGVCVCVCMRARA